MVCLTVENEKWKLGETQLPKTIFVLLLESFSLIFICYAKFRPPNIGPPKKREIKCNKLFQTNKFWYPIFLTFIHIWHFIGGLAQSEIKGKILIYKHYI